MNSSTSTLDEVKALVCEALEIEDRIDSMDASTRLLGELPELDSMAVVVLVTEIEDKFHFKIEDADFTADVFETVGSLTAFVDENRP